MSRSTTAVPVSRPKIHRPPAFLTQKPKKSYSKAAIGAAAVLSLFLAVSLAVHKMPSKQNEDEFEDPLPLSSAHASLVKKSANTIALVDKSSGIIGQMAKIPAESEQIVEVKPTSEVDNNSARELLSIISKY